MFGPLEQIENGNRWLGVCFAIHLIIEIMPSNTALGVAYRH